MTRSRHVLENHPSVAERAAAGREARTAARRRDLADHAPTAERRDPVDVLSDGDADRQQSLLPIRYARMSASPFAFLRGAAAVMAADLAASPTTGLTVQAIGDAHISNFGVFATPGRRLIFDVNDFDESLRAPWEWDVKRLVASVVVAAEDNGMSRRRAAAAAAAAAAAYRESMRSFATSTTLGVWYAHLDVDDTVSAQPSGRDRKRQEKDLAKIRRRTGSHVVAKLTEVVDGRVRFLSMPPLLTPLRELVDEADADTIAAAVTAGFGSYRRSLAPELRQLLDRFELVDIARKVVGVGSVGTRCLVTLLQGKDADDALVLQFKEAGRSVLEPYAGASPYRHHGARVVHGQRLIQVESDIFLGWSSFTDDPTHYYWRQLKDMKASAEIGLLSGKAFERYIAACAWCLARAHARSGDPVAIAAYLGRGDASDRAMAAFACSYADQTRLDWQALKQAISDGRLAAAEGLGA